MYTETGKNHLNLHTAGYGTKVATHIVMGIDALTIDGTDQEPYITDRYLGGFQSAKVEIFNSSVVNGDIVFASSYDSSQMPMFLGNVMGIVFEDAGARDARVRVRKNVFNDFTNGWKGSAPLTPANTPRAWPDASGGMILDSTHLTATIEGEYNLAQYQGMDILSIPVFWTNSAPTGGILTVKLYYMRINSEGKNVMETFTLSDNVVADGVHFKFSKGSPKLHEGGALLTVDPYNPYPTVWQRRLNTGVDTASPSQFFNYLNSIFKVEMTWTGTSTIYIGSPQITPDFDADSASIVVAYGNLNKNVVHDGQTHIAAEYRIRGLI